MRLDRTRLKSLFLVILPNLSMNPIRRDHLPRIVVLVNWENLGDFVLFSAAIRETRENFPHSKLLVVAQRENSALTKYCPYVDQWIWIKGHRPPKIGEAYGRDTSYSYKMIRTYLSLLIHGGGKVDYLIGPDWLLVDNSRQFVENILYRKVNSKRNSFDRAALMNRAKFKEQSHQTIRMLSVLEMFGLTVKSQKIETWAIPQDREPVKLQNKNLPNRSLTVLISLGAGQMRRNWPIENILTLIQLFTRDYPNVSLKILGPTSLDTNKLSRIFPNSESLTNLVGKTDLREIVELIQEADLLVSNDSGLVHIAASLKLPCVVVSAHPLNGDPWHLHSPNRYYPWETRYIELQPKALLTPCIGSCQAELPHCITTVLPTEVFQACKSLLTRVRLDSA